MIDTLKTIAATAGLGLILVVLGMAGRWWISTEVADQLAAAGIVPQSDVDAIVTRIDSLEHLHEKDVIRVEDKAERIAQILMED